MRNATQQQLAQALWLQQYYLERLCGTEFIDLPRKPIREQGGRSLQSLHEQIHNCHICALSKTKAKPNIGHVPIKPLIAFVSETPLTSGSHSSCLIGRSGEILHNMIEKILRVPFRDIAFLSILKCSPPMTISLYDECLLACVPYLFEQLHALCPKLIVLLGDTVTRYVLGVDFLSMRGKVGEWENMSLIVTYSPRFLLRNPSYKKDAMQDLLLIKRLL